MNDTRRPAYVDRRPPAAHDNASKLLGLSVVTVAVVGMMSVLFWVLAANDSDPGDALAIGGAEESAAAAEPAPEPSAPSPTPTPTPVTTPPAPAQNQLDSNDWLLSPYVIIQEAGDLTVTGTIQNLASAPRSAVIRVFVYVDGTPIGTGTGEVRDVPGGGTLEVSLPSGTRWQPGNKLLLVEASDL